MLFIPGDSISGEKEKKKKWQIFLSVSTQLTFVDQCQSSGLNSIDLNLCFSCVLKTMNREKYRVKGKIEMKNVCLRMMRLNAGMLWLFNIIL